MIKLPMRQDELENFVLHHVHEWSQEYVARHVDDGAVLWEAMDEEFFSFLSGLRQKWTDEVRPAFIEKENA